jgi:uncharacterized protein (TIGR03437 family)
VGKTCRCILLAVTAQAVFAQRVITTFAGTDTIPIAGGIPAIQASIGVNAVNADRSGNFYVSDEFQNVVLKVDSQDNIFVIAGNGIQTFSGDGGLAVNASLNEPQAVAVAANGEIYISDSFNHRIRKIDSQGIITTVAGNGQPGFSGDGGPATLASLNRPYRIALDSSGNLYIVDSLNDRVRKVDTAGIITTVAGTGQAGFAGDGGPASLARLGNPVGIAIGPDDRLYIADKDNHRVRKVDQNGVITTIAGTGQAGFSGDGGPALNATFNQTYGLDFDSSGNLYVVDYVNDRIRRIDKFGVITTVAGNGQRGFAGDGGPATDAPLEFPFSVAIDSSSRILISDTFNNRIRRVTSGVISTAAGNGRLQNPGDNGPATSAQLNRPSGVAIAPNGVAYIADTLQYLIRRVAVDGTVTTIAGNGRLGYGGDNGPALNASFNSPESVAIDPTTGLVYVADTYNHRIRKISASGIVTTVAGNEFAFFAGDGGPATQASLNFPRGISFDTDGTLYIADSGNNRIRKVTPNGIISTVAGNGQANYSGEGSALNVSLNNPVEVLPDGAGNFYICDQWNNRIRKVTSAGTISTVAGNGQFGFSGDGGPATGAALANPGGIGLDAAGNLYIADTLNDRIRVVDTLQRISTFAGNGVRGFAGDGDLAVLASLGAPESVFPTPSGDVFISDTRNKRIRRVLSLAPTFEITRSSLSFDALSDGEATSEQAIGVSATVVGMFFNASVTTADASWLKLNTPVSVTPGRVGIVADPTGLAPGTYQASFAVTAPNTQNLVRTVSVTFNVGAAARAKLSVNPKGMSFTASAQSRPQTQTITVANSGGGALDFLASASAITGDTSWLSISTDSGTVRPGAAGNIVVTADPRDLPPGSYNGVVSFASPTTGETIDVPVTLGVTASHQRILLSQTGLTFTAVAGGGDTAPQNLSVANDGEGSMDFSITASTLSGDGWLSAAADSSSTDAAGLVAGVNVRVIAAGLSPGRYTGRLRVDAPGADNSPQFVSVFLNVLPAGSNPGPTLQFSSLRFNAVAGGANPGSQTLLVYTTTANPVSFTSSRAFYEGKDWFVYVPSGGTARRDQPARIVIQPNIEGLTPGVRTGALNLQFSDGSVRTVGILLVLTGGGASQASKGTRLASEDCVASRLLPSFTSLSQDYSVPSGWPVSLQVRVSDDCGNALSAGSVTASFSNGDPVLSLTSLKDGRWGATWQTRSARPTVTVSINAASVGSSLKGATSLTIGLQTTESTPIVNTNGIVNSASLDGRLPPAPGAMISILGSSLSVGSDHAASWPLPTQLAGTTVLLAGRELPLVAASDGRIDAIVPFDISVNARHQLIVLKGNSLTIPSDVTLAPAQPAIFTQDGSGGGQGMIYVALPDGSMPIAGAASPAHSGNTLIIIATGLGAVDTDISAGDPAPSDPLAHTVNSVTVSIGGVDAQASFSGLYPGESGVYQLNVVVPDGAATGDAVPVVVKVAGKSSPPVTMAIQ